MTFILKTISKIYGSWTCLCYDSVMQSHFKMSKKCDCNATWGKIHKWVSLKQGSKLVISNCFISSEAYNQYFYITNFEVLKPRCVTNSLQSHRNLKTKCNTT